MMGMDESTIAAVALTLKLALVTSVLLMLIVTPMEITIQPNATGTAAIAVKKPVC